MSPPVPTSGADHITWGLERDGRFRIRSAYTLAAEDEVEPREGVWKTIWRWKGPQRIRQFIWLVAHQRLLTNGERRRRHLTEIGACQVCPEEEETVLHVLRDCPLASATWELLAFPSDNHSFFQTPLLPWIEDFIRRPELSLLFGVTCWFLWRYRNDRVFNGKLTTAVTLTRHIQAWLALEGDTLNRDRSITNTIPPARTELVWDRGFCKVQLQIDSHCAVLLLQSDDREDHIHATTIQRAQDLFRRDWEVRITHVFRESNHVADHLANREEAVKRSSFITVPPFLNPQQLSGDIARGMAEADYRIINAEMKLNSQYYFYMEMHTALAIPDEDKCLVVYTSSQWPEATGVAIAQCLGIPQHNVRVITRRVGGAFGGKAMKSVPIAASCALAAQVLQRPVRMYMNRKTDMIIAGGRHPMKVSYSVGFKSNGKITGLKLDILVNAGMSPDVSAIIPNHLAGSIKKYNWGALSLDIKLCKTNHSSKSAMRAPGEIQGTFIADSVMEHVASTLSMDVDHVKTINLHSNDTLKLFYPRGCGKPDEYTLPCIWDKLDEWSNFNKRREMVKKFNSHNLWRKKRISRMPIIFELRASPTPGKVSILSDGSIVVEVGGVEMGQGLWTKAKQMASFALSSIRCEEDGNSMLERIRVIQADSLSLIQGGLTAGSTKSESTCEAIRLCCNVLVERLLPLKEKLDKETGFVRWEMLISQAHKASLNLSAASFYVPDFTIEGAFVQGIGFFMSEEYNTNSEGIVTTDSTWTYKIPTIDTITKQFNVQILSSGHHQNRVLSSKASGEPPVLLAASIHSATREAIKEARKQLHSWGGLDSDHANFQLDAPATMAVVKKLCGFNSVETYLKWKLNHK
ncbi:Aldehyde oxidase 4 [Linum perenne]